MSQTQRVLIVLAVWAAIYLSALGSLEIKGEEGRRILPAVTMLESGNYLVPQVGSEPYFRKPPLINWLVAASFKITAIRNEWTARLPSALSVLAAALAFAFVSRRALGARGSFFAALMWMTSFGLIEKGRLIEIEGLYVSLFAIAFVCWFSWWQERRSPWLTWLVPFVVLGFGLLAKGPLNLFFFYAIAIALLWRAGEMKSLLRPPHLIAVALMLMIFFAWAIPCLLIASAGHVTTIWSRQFSGRLAGEGFDLAVWSLNLPRSLGYFLPWLIFIPAFKNNPDSDPRPKGDMATLAWSTAGALVVIDLIPGALPRYAMPLLAPAVWLVANTISAETVRWPRWAGGRSIGSVVATRIVIALIMITCAAMIVFSLFIVPHLQKRQKIKNNGAQINAVVPATETLVALNPQYQPYLFYVRASLRYVSDATELPTDARYILAQRRDASDIEASTRWLPRHARNILQIKDYRGHETTVYRVE